jgi:hypothetical protein
LIEYEIFASRVDQTGRNIRITDKITIVRGDMLG